MKKGRRNRLVTGYRYVELLNYAERNGIIDISRLKIDVEMSKREEYLKRHTYNI